tara:strand:- start:20 stop:424 length:405 start_codon:yes stop_codon:yes gene_type:complete
MDQKKLLIFFFKITFFLWLFIIFIVSVYPGNLIGLIFKGDPTVYPGGPKTNFFLEYSSHVITYFLLSFLSYLSFDYEHKSKVLIISLTFFSIMMELLHLMIPNRAYEHYDLLMNLLGFYLGLSLFFLKRFKLFT